VVREPEEAVLGKVYLSLEQSSCRVHFAGIAAVVVALFSCASNLGAQTRSLGLDVSAWQGNISQTTWNNFHNNDDMDFVFLRASRGGTTGYYNQSNADNDPPTNTLSQRYDDPYFVQNITRATAAGLFAGSYHFARPDIISSTLNSGGIANTGTDEADHFIQMAGPWMRPGYLLPVLDLEAGISQRTPNQMAQFAIDFSDRVFEVMGVRPAIYIGNSYAGHVGAASVALREELVTKMPVTWIPRWPTSPDPQTDHPGDFTPSIYGPWDDNSSNPDPWSFWQYTAEGDLSSYNGNLDLNVAQGGIEFVKDRLVPAIWMNDNSGEWTLDDNWNSGQTPIAPVQGPGQVARVGAMTLPAERTPAINDTVILERPGDITVTLSSGSHSIRKLYAREALNITGGSLNIGYVPSPDSTAESAQFSANVSLSGTGSLSVHTLKVDTTRTLALNGGSLTFNQVNLMPNTLNPAMITVGGDVTLNPLNNATALISKPPGAGSGFVDLGGAIRTFTIGNGTAATDVSITVPLANGGLTKNGPGTLRLASNSAYQFDTSVLQGSLAIDGPFLSNTADVYLSTGAALELNFAATDTVNKFFIDGVAQATGIWGALDSGAQYTTPLITGTGFLEVMSTIAPIIPGDFNGDGFVDGLDLAQWQEDHGVNDESDADGDGDSDGRDFIIWQRNFTGSPPLAASVSVPEPATYSLLMLSLAALALRRK
jgi:autotransporter-associated beta strand protein